MKDFFNLCTKLLDMSGILIFFNNKFECIFIYLFIMCMI